ncbi:GDSL-type esterase/lipase family protein [Azoarcus olearius]|uniref:Acyl-CoA thioesterase I n=1 Tax=Azoarcus sp. (strain BH72) TaxID=418699 RepID=A1K7D5_AZOSB|nr:GDSL-type esterase/lipase family protein [Azoarcus olearius]CAL94740.1 putative acyl-CoA thioesterase I [Azoarcus olearius]
MRRWLLFALTLALAACGSDRPKYAPLPPGSVVLAFGDSVTWGTGAARGEDYPTRLAALSGWRIENAGVPGDLAETARNRIDEALEEHAPRLVLVELGGNDFLRRRPEQDVAEDLRAILRSVKAAGAQPVLVAVPAFSPLAAATSGLKDALIYRRLADEEAVPLVGAVFADVLSDTKLRADPIHPNAQGYHRLAEGIAESLRDHGLLAN